MSFEELLDNLWGFDAEIFAHDSLFVFINYRTKERKVFHNCPANDLYEWLEKTKPILLGYNCNNYDKHILRCWLAGASPEELKKVNDHIINDGNGWDIQVEYHELPVMWDLFNEITPRKSLKELEGNLRLNITETTVPFDLPTKWTKEQYEEVLYYCTCDVEALFPIFNMLINKYKSKYVIAKFGRMQPDKALAMTDANLTAKLLKGKKQTYNDAYKYTYPSEVEKDKIPKLALNYFDDLIEHNDLEYKPKAPCIDYDTMELQIGEGGCHGFIKESSFMYDKGEKFKCEF